MCLTLAAILYVSTATEVEVHVHEHTSGNDEYGDIVDAYVPRGRAVLPYEVDAVQKMYEDDPDGGADTEADEQY